MKSSKRSPLPGGSKPVPPKSWNTQWLFGGALCLLALAVYANSLVLGLPMDGHALVQQDVRIRTASLENLRLIATTPYWWPHSLDRLFRPVTTASFLVNYAVLEGGESPGGYHAVNVLLHMCNALLVFCLASRVLARRWQAFLAAAIWAVHPVGSDAVANIAGRADLLATACLLGGLLLYLRLCDRTAPTVWWLVAALFVVATAGVFAKETGAVLFGLMVLWDATLGRATRWTPIRFAAYGAVAASIAILWAARAAVFRSQPWPQTLYVMNPLLGADFWTARLTAVKVLALDLWLLIFPASLLSDRSYHHIPLFRVQDAAGWAALVAIALVLAVLVVRRRDIALLWAAGFFAVTLFPASNLAVTIGATMAERFLYLPSAGSAIAMTLLVARALDERRAVIVLGAVILLFGIRTIARNAAWSDDWTLATTDVQAAPGNFRFHATLASILFEQDRRGNLDRAIQEEEAAWQVLQDLPPDRQFVPVPADLGMFYGFKGDLAGREAGRPWFEKALAVLLRARAASEAAERARDAAQLEHGRPLGKRESYGRIYSLLGTALGRLGRSGEAMQAYHYGRVVHPTDPGAYDDLTRGYVDRGDPAGAARAVLEKGLALGFDPRTVSQIQSFYGKLPGGECAVRQGPLPVPDFSCARLRADVCPAFAEVTGVFREARDPVSVASFEDIAGRVYGCPR